MELVEPHRTTFSASLPGIASPASERDARRTLRGQIARLERELADAFVTAFPHRLPALAGAAAGASGPHLLDLGELERVRDDLAERLHAARRAIAVRADEQERNRIRLEQMLLEPRRHPFETMPLRDLGQPGCGRYQVRPRLGLVGMLRGWWQVKLSSGCPLAGGRGAAPRPVCARTRGAAPRSAREGGSGIRRPIHPRVHVQNR